MPGADAERERTMTGIAEALHELCQPLTALYCRLEIGQMTEAAAPNGGPTIWTDCLRECERLTVAVATMRALIRQAQANEQERDR